MPNVQQCTGRTKTKISSLATQEFNQLCLISHVMADGALGNLVF